MYIGLRDDEAQPKRRVADHPLSARLLVLIDAPCTLGAEGYRDQLRGAADRFLKFNIIISNCAMSFSEKESPNFVLLHKISSAVSAHSFAIK
jgi:hypothetical protein